ncbi:hypothetical protein [Hydrogenophaga sp. BPS33]|uniref:hypothetical protein n=1 Tax=Hydrogenophaga sp. BPS33 TaxID=2651974 RepID=UPI00131F59F2|nr:hypothetical protein [Hydrogenophaga sp. BPS33]QHE84060.1 hypothetical protein F9K07_03735 [Hydrogenophaga sp. BPS33]
MANTHGLSGASSTCADSTHASPSPSSSPVITPISPSVSLASKASDRLMELSDAFESYIALQCFVEPEYADEVEANVPPSRGQLTALLRTLNGDMRRKIDVVADAVALLQAQVSMDAAQLARR